ncbi:MAG: imidazoleglycerol-phosphate dehydratase, partial [Oscillospiraceae bacterium]|nr:imidazoleglycerol-phosphate dehydratase [Oscillospiraceae bacterium]
DIDIKSVGDLYVDCHHTVEDVGIALGLALGNALTDKSQIARYGSAYIPMDEALGFSAVDISGRPFLVFDCDFKNEKIGNFDTCMCVEFMRALAFNAGLTLHAKCLYGENDHHKCEAIFKAVAHALKMAVAQTNKTVLSTKGSLA